MNKKEAIEFIENNYITRQWNEEKLQEAIEVLKQPPTLAEILGWEEDVEYEVNDVIYKISENVLFSKSKNSNYDFSIAYLDLDEIEKLRQAKKIEDKKYCLKHRFLAVGSRKEDLYLARNKYDHLCLTNDFSKSKTFNEKYAFSICEIEEIKKKYNTDLKDFDLIEVEDEK